MNIIQTIRSWFFGKEEITETPVTEIPVVEEKVETLPPVEVTTTYVAKEEIAELVKRQEEKPKPKRKYNKKKKSTGESK